MPWVEFEPTIPALERAKTVRALDRMATVLGIPGRWCCTRKNNKHRFLNVKQRSVTPKRMSALYYKHIYEVRNRVRWHECEDAFLKKTRIIQNKFSRRNKFAIFQTLRIKSDFTNIFFVTLFQIRIKCDSAVLPYIHSIFITSLYSAGISRIQGVPEGKFSILGGHSVGHSKQKVSARHVLKRSVKCVTVDGGIFENILH
jgi:hypothetical protein